MLSDIIIPCGFVNAIIPDGVIVGLILIMISLAMSNKKLSDQQSGSLRMPRPHAVWRSLECSWFEPVRFAHQMRASTPIPKTTLSTLV